MRKDLNVLMFYIELTEIQEETRHFFYDFFFFLFFCCFFVDILKLISFQCFYLHINFFLRRIVMGIRAFIETEQ